MRFFRILIILLVIGGLSVILYFLFVQKTHNKMSLSSFLNGYSALYYLNNADITSTLLEYTTDNSSLSIEHIWPEESCLKSTLIDSQTIVSWHVTRQKKISQVIWIKSLSDYDLLSDSALMVKKIGDFYEVKIEELKCFVYLTDQLLVIGRSSEVIESIAGSVFVLNNYFTRLEQNELQGSIKSALSYITTRFPKFDQIPISESFYKIKFYGNGNKWLFSGTIDSIPLHCARYNSVEFNKVLPISTDIAWQYSFSRNTCLANALPDSLHSFLWDTEDRYQFKFANLLDAWFDGSLVYMHCNLEGKQQTFAACKLKHDAAPFSNGSRFFTEHSTLSLEKDNPQMNFTFARMVPNELSRIVFWNSGENQKLYVSQVYDWLYFSTDKTPLLLLINELVNGQKITGFSSHNESVGAFYLHLNEWLYSDKKTLSNKPEEKLKPYPNQIKVRFIPSGHGMYFQGSVY